MMENKFEIGKGYFLLSYLDKEFKYPIISTLVYLGLNIEDEGEGDLWFFQDAESYINLGAYNCNDGAPKIRNNEIVTKVYDFPEDGLQDILTLAELSSRLVS